MYLARIELNPCVENARILSNPYRTHQTLWEAFEEGERDFLFRSEYTRSASQNWLIYLISEREPNFTRLQEKTKMEVLHSAVKPFHPKIKPGARFRFYLRANPTVKREGKRHPLYRSEEQHKWLIRKGEQHGFRVLSCEDRNRQNYYSARKGTRLMTHFGLDFFGLLQVKEPEIFQEALKKGLGSGKAFGFGLLSILPA
jgi:CRISPR system Cascade subunit CasE